MQDEDDIELLEEEEATVRSAVDAAVDRMIDMLRRDDFKMSVGDFIRLVDFQKEMQIEQIGHVKVTWVDPFEEPEHVSET